MDRKIFGICLASYAAVDPTEMMNTNQGDASGLEQLYMNTNQFVGVFEVLNQASTVHDIEVILWKGVAEDIFASKNCVKAKPLEEGARLIDSYDGIVKSEDVCAQPSSDVS